jgi:hypothetical protein
MPITYTNRKGVTYHLCQRRTPAGTLRYSFTRQPMGEPVDEIPPGYTIQENVNGLVTLGRERPSQLQSEEVAAVTEQVRHHPQAHKYRVDIRPDRIDIYERVGIDAAELAAAMGLVGARLTDQVAQLEASLERHAQYARVLRFLLRDVRSRTYQVERICYLGGIDDWIPVGAAGTINELAGTTIPLLGTEEFFELW